METRSRTFVEAAEAINAARANVNPAASEAARDRAIGKVDDALDALLAAPSRSVADFATKLRTLEAEHGCDWQPRHIKSLIADLAVFAS